MNERGLLPRRGPRSGIDGRLDSRGRRSGVPWESCMTPFVFWCCPAKEFIRQPFSASDWPPPGRSERTSPGGSFKRRWSSSAQPMLRLRHRGNIGARQFGPRKIKKDRQRFITSRKPRLRYQTPTTAVDFAWVQRTRMWERCRLYNGLGFTDGDCRVNLMILALIRELG